MKKLAQILHRLGKNLYNKANRQAMHGQDADVFWACACVFMERRDMLYGEMDVFSRKIQRNPGKGGSASDGADCNLAFGKGVKADKKAK